MKYKLTTAAVIFCLAATIGAVTSRSSQAPDGKEVKEAAPPAIPTQPSGENREPPLDGQQLVAQAAYQLLLAPGLEAKTRQSVHLFDQKLVGSGTYRQLTNGPKLYLELDLKLQGTDRVGSLRQISDGDSLWEIRTHGDAPSFSHVNLGQLREVAGQAGPNVPPSFWMALGGLPRLLAQLADTFTFQSPQPTEIGEYPVWQIEGEWSRSMLAKIFPDRHEAIPAGQQPNLDEWPSQVPHGVTLVLGRDQKVPLFPYRFSFYRRVRAQGSSQAERVPLVTWELFELRVRPELQPGDFDFRPADQEFQDLTERYVARLKAAAEKLEEK